MFFVFFFLILGVQQCFWEGLKSFRGTGGGAPSSLAESQTKILESLKSFEIKAKIFRALGI